MGNFTKGDRVIIKPELAERFILPQRKWAHERRQATVVAPPDPSMGRSGYIIEFDAKRKVKYQHTLRLSVSADEIQTAETSNG